MIDSNRNEGEIFYESKPTRSIDLVGFSFKSKII